MQVGTDEIRPRNIDKDLAGRDPVRLTVEDGHLVAYGFGGQRLTVPLQGGGPRPITLEYYRVAINKPEIRHFRNYTGLAVYGAGGDAEIDIWGAWDMVEVHHFAESHGLLVVDNTDTPLDFLFKARRKLRTIPRDKWVTDILLLPGCLVIMALCVSGPVFLGRLIDSMVGWTTGSERPFDGPLSFVGFLVGWIIFCIIGIRLVFILSGLFRAGLRSLLRRVRRQ